MATMIEQMARARCAAKGFNPDEEISLSGQKLQRWRWMAEFMRPELEAMREPTEEIPDPDAWRAAVEAILKA